MIKAKDAIATARALIGTPYSELDCIALIRAVIRKSPGGVSGYTTAGTNTLWDSYEASAKYRDLTWRQESIAGAKAGMLAFKRSGSDVHHVGIVTGVGTVIHSSSTQGGRGVVETSLTTSEGWNLLGIHRYIETGTTESEGNDMESYKARVMLKNENSTLNVRSEPSTKGGVIGQLHHGEEVTVQAIFDSGWMFVSYGDSGSGYVSGEYLQRIEEPPAENIITVSGDVTIIDDAGNTFKPVGGWRVYMGSMD